MKNPDFQKILEKHKFLVLDGGMGTMLQAAGLQPGGIPELLNFTDPELITNIHRSYVNAGANVVYTNTFGANRLKMTKTHKSVQNIIRTAIANAKQSGAEYIALDIGPIGQLLEPTGTLKFEEAYDIFREQIEAGSDADLIVFETMTDLLEVRAAVLAAKEHSDKPLLVTMSFEENRRTFTGCEIPAMALTLEGLGVDAIGVNCSLGPVELLPIVEELCRWTTLPVIVKPNAGLPDPVTSQYHFDPEEFAECCEKFIDLGAVILGGCCGTTPEHIRAVAGMLRRKLSDSENIKNIKINFDSKKIPSAVCSANKTVIINQPRVIGERINPTGKKRFKQALIEHDLDYILNQAIAQINAGADLLDINVGLPDIDEISMMQEAVKAIQGITDTPLQLDSTNPEVLEAGLRCYNGKPIVNSVNGENASLNIILPLVKKYGAAVVGLTLDENGIPKTAEGRFAIAEKILNRALALGIRREDIYIDCLTLTASAEQEGVMQTLDALHRVKTELGLHTVLGVSNISFGLPNRELVTRNFLTMALYAGLDLPIVNPNTASMMSCVRTYKLLANIDRNAVDYIAHYGTESPENNHNNTINISNHNPDSGTTLESAILSGLKSEAGTLTQNLLASSEPMQIVNNMLIPALDKAGADFEAGKIFLPQLISSASAAQAAFEVIKNHLCESNTESVNRGTIVLATVKGDIHDIGKNIVKILLENYGYQVIDLGKDVPYETVAEVTEKSHAPLVGLSALMTTTLPSMEATIQLLHERCPWCKTVVGGAVLTADYAEKIGADFYAKDAKETVDIAKRIFQN
ncbi:MAG: homocysteine S-methyltransferase family protein [Oscillospiraceae bacterium]|nr:homocysteine S-methyltransferase family protein [Oscillospiraceae bacterium]